MPNGISRVRWQFPRQDRYGNTYPTPLSVTVPARDNLAIATIHGRGSCDKPAVTTLYDANGHVVDRYGNPATLNQVRRHAEQQSPSTSAFCQQNPSACPTPAAKTPRFATNAPVKPMAQPPASSPRKSPSDRGARESTARQSRLWIRAQDAAGGRLMRKRQDPASRSALHKDPPTPPPNNPDLHKERDHDHRDLHGRSRDHRSVTATKHVRISAGAPVHERPSASTATGHGGTTAGSGLRAPEAELAGRSSLGRRCGSLGCGGPIQPLVDIPRALAAPSPLRRPSCR